MVIGLGTKAAEDTGALPIELRPGGRRDSNPQPPHLRMKEPPSAQQADRDVKVRDSYRDIGGCEATVRTRTSWFRARRGTSSTTSHCVWTGGLEPPTPGSRSRCAPVAPRPGGTDGRIRTDTDGGLSAVPLPVGLRQRECVDRVGFEPTSFSVQGSCASSCATGPLVAGAGIEPATRGVWGLADPRSPAVRWGDRPDSNRLPPGPHPGVSSTSTSATVDEGGVEPPASSV